MYQTDSNGPRGEQDRDTIQTEDRGQSVVVLIRRTAERSGRARGGLDLRRRGRTDRHRQVETEQYRAGCESTVDLWSAEYTSRLSSNQRPVSERRCVALSTWLLTVDCRSVQSGLALETNQSDKLSEYGRRQEGGGTE